LKVWLGAIGSALAVHAGAALAMGGGGGSSLSDGTGPTLEVDVELVAPPSPPPPPAAPVAVPVIDPVTIPLPVAYSQVPIIAAPSVAPAGDPSSDPITDPAPTTTAAPRFPMTVHYSSGGSSGTGIGTGAGAAQPIEETALASTVAVPARVTGRVEPAYPFAAREDGVEADVHLEIVVDAAGSVVEARTLEHAGSGFDESALSAIRGYRFSPAMKDGHLVRVRMPWTVEFRLR